MICLKEELQIASQNFISELQTHNILTNINQYLVELGDRYFWIQGQPERIRQAKFIEFLIDIVQQQEPFAAIRLGDGEGNLLFLADPGQNTLLAECNFLKIKALMFGRHPILANDKQLLIADFVKAIKEADIIGIPTPVQTENAVVNIANDIRGMSGILGVWYWVNKNIAIFQDKPKYFGIAFSHIYLADYIEKLFSVSRTISAITCYSELFNILEKRYHFNKGLLLTIPPQSSNIKATPNEIHFPIRYKEILAELQQDLRGHTFLVGAGLLGKIYCAAIKRSGGIAIDIGSLMDLFIGQSVRSWHSAAMLERYSIK